MVGQHACLSSLAAVARHAIRGALFAVLALSTACAGSTATVPQTVSKSGAGLILTDLHFNPLAFDPPANQQALLADTLFANRLAQAPTSQWDAIFATSPLTAYSYSVIFPGYGALPGDTNFPLLQSTLTAMRQRVPSPDILFIAGDSLAHDFPYLFATYVTSKSTPYATMVDKTEQYVAMKLSRTFPNAQIVPALGDWDTPCGYPTGTGSDTFPGTAFLTAYSSAWSGAVNRYGGARDFQATFVANGGYYSTTIPIDPRGRLIVLDTQPWSATYPANGGCEPGGANPNAGNNELAWLTNQLNTARNQGQRVWILGHIPPGVPGENPTGQDTGAGLSSPSRNEVKGAACPTIFPFYADSYSTPLYLLLAQNRAILTLGIFGHEHRDDYRVLQDSSGSAILGMKVLPSITPFQSNYPAFVQFAYDANLGAISDSTTWYLTNFSSATTKTPGVWGAEYAFDTTYGQTALDSNGLAGAVSRILVPQSSAQAAFASYFPASNPAAGFAPSAFFQYGCALTKLTAADYSTCYCAH